MTPVRATIIVNKNPGNAVTRAGANRNRSSYTNDSDTQFHGGPQAA
jgi:hypothetical protein